MSEAKTEAKTVAIVGAGPVGLAAAAHVLERGLRPIVLEAGADIGHAVRQWSHVQLFSPWEYNIDRAAARLLRDIRLEFSGARTNIRPAANWSSATSSRSRPRPHSRRTSTPPAASPTSAAPDSTSSSPRAGKRHRSKSAIRTGMGPKMVRADAVIDASGTWHAPNPAGANGLRAVGETEAADRIAYGMPDVLGKDRARYAGKTVAVLGAGHSAIGTLTELAQLAAQVPGTNPVWLLRGNDPAKAFGGGANDKLSARGELGAAFAAVVGAGRIKVESEFRVSHLGAEGPRLIVSTGAGCMLPSDRGR